LEGARLPVLGIVPHAERAARKYGHASPIVARRKNLNPIDLINVTGKEGCRELKCVNIPSTGGEIW